MTISKYVNLSLLLIGLGLCACAVILNASTGRSFCLCSVGVALVAIFGTLLSTGGSSHVLPPTHPENNSMSCNDWIEKFGSEWLKSARGLNIDITKYYYNERVTRDLGKQWTVMPANSLVCAYTPNRKQLAVLCLIKNVFTDYKIEPLYWCDDGVCMNWIDNITVWRKV